MPNLRLFWRQKQTALPQALLGVTLRREIDVFSADEPAPELPAELEHIRWCCCRSNNAGADLIQGVDVHRSF